MLIVSIALAVCGSWCLARGVMGTVMQLLKWHKASVLKIDVKVSLSAEMYLLTFGLAFMATSFLILL